MDPAPRVLLHPRQPEVQAIETFTVLSTTEEHPQNLKKIPPVRVHA